MSLRRALIEGHCRSVREPPEFELWGLFCLNDCRSWRALGGLSAFGIQLGREIHDGAGKLPGSAYYSNSTGPEQGYYALAFLSTKGRRQVDHVIDVRVDRIDALTRQQRA